MSLDKAIQDSFDTHFDLERRRKLNSQLAQRLKGTVGIDGNTPHRRTRRLDAQLNAEQLKELLVMYQIPNNESFWHNPATDIVHFITSEEYSKGAQFFFQYCLTMKIPFNENQLTAFTKEFVTAFRNLSL